MTRVRTNFAEVTAELNSLKKGLGDKALRSTVNKEAGKGRTAMTRAITKKYVLKAGDVRPKLKIGRSRRSQKAIVSSITGVGSLTFNLIRFVEKKVSLAQARIRGRKGTLNQLRVKVKRRGGLKPIPGAFIANKGRTVFRRKPGTTMAARSRYAGTKHAEQLEALRTIGIPRMFNAKDIRPVVTAKIEAGLPATFDNEARFYLRKFNGS